MILGYARVSSEKQSLARQLKQLQEYKCEKIYREKTSGCTTNRIVLQEMLGELQEGDIIVVTDLTRITRSTQDLFSLLELIKSKGVILKSLKDTWLDMSSDNPYSTFLLTVMAGVNQLERDLINMRQKEGIAIAKEKGKYRGRVKTYNEKNKSLLHAIELYKQGEKTVKEICDITKIGRASFYQYLRSNNITR